MMDTLAPLLLIALLQDPPLVSPEVGADGRVTFRIQAPKAEHVRISSWELKPWLSGAAKELSKNDLGVWSTTLGPVEPGIYDYAFDVDGVRTVDMSSGQVFGARRGARGIVEVPGPKDRPRQDEWRDVPHGAVTTHWYASGGARRRVHVYTPPGYAKEPERRYPTLFLLHGSGDDDSHWTTIGRANVIADNLVADGKAERMILVMTDGDLSLEDYERDLLDRVIPLVGSEYRVKAESGSRAIAGLSNGGGQALWTGLRNLDRFAWIGAFSASSWEMAAGVPGAERDPAKVNAALRLLWIRMGREDHLLETSRTFVRMLKANGVALDYAETEGGHSWSVWRRYLVELLPRLFQPSDREPRR
jgi:enterochelin esterase family protein